MLASGAPLQLARLATALPPPTVPTALAAIEVPSGCAADYATWAAGGAGMGTPALTQDLIVAQARALKLPGLARVCESVARQARDAQWSYEDYLRDVLSAEQTSRPDGDEAGARRHRVSSKARFFTRRTPFHAPLSSSFIVHGSVGPCYSLAPY